MSAGSFYSETHVRFIQIGMKNHIIEFKLANKKQIRFG